MYLVEVFFLLFYVLIFYKTEAKLTDKEYALMPELYHLDHFDNCMEYGETALYCNIVTQLSPEDPQNHSDTWTIIKEAISDPRYFRHDLLRHGICVHTSCPNIDVYTNDPEVLKAEISACYSDKYQHLGVQAVVKEIHCETNQPYYSIDNYDIAVAITLGILIWIVIFASFYEGIARYNTKEEYEKIVNTRVGRIIACFSIPNNWYRLTTTSNSPDGQALRCLQGIRFYNLQLTIMAHVGMIYFVGPVMNPPFIEDMTRKPENILFNNGMVVIQTFLLISGFLISYNFLQLFEKQKEFRLRTIVLAFIYRYIRLTACLLVMIALNGTWLYHIARGPSWDRLVGTEYRNCRKNWWVNLIYMNNLYDVENMCMQHSWYLATDTQLFLAALVVVAFMWKYQKRIKLILGIAVTIGVLLPGAVNYYNDFDIVLRQYPEHYYSFFLTYPQWKWMYTSPLTNFGAYALGLSLGYVYLLKKNDKVFQTKVSVAIWWILVWGLPLGVIFYGLIIYQDGYEYTRIGAAIYATLYRNFFTLGICILIYGMIFQIGWFMRDCILWSPLEVLGRLTYCAYLIHVALMRNRGGQARMPAYMSYYTVINQMIVDSVMTYIFATIMALFVELPVSALQKTFISNMAKNNADPPEAKTGKAVGDKSKDSGQDIAK